jgi:hypothetical protein
VFLVASWIIPPFRLCAFNPTEASAFGLLREFSGAFKHQCASNLDAVFPFPSSARLVGRLPIFNALFSRAVPVRT